MNKSKLSAILGLSVSDAVLTGDDAGIAFENGASLAVYNKYELAGFTLSEAHLLIGSAVTYVNETDDAVIIEFGGKFLLKVNMQDEAYTGPEAMQMRVPGTPVVIWN
ncbi:hypothetical protein I6J77_00735 [Rhodanobacter sp. FDAARGOS 1247]|uniref:hypothetical protein n=1 Tax=Rhodanobacter sp. FDAARGOS 1247 TaxID=2778082 RepID=UPI00194F2912|nr:hypothetical protein [Rhodanobacter sp. FDAARGOS 1247]QRP64037.1 hypothetical protein I6J77_00735 [Rhodanobacter sp. FDAARGOS 1247]